MHRKGSLSVRLTPQYTRSTRFDHVWTRSEQSLSSHFEAKSSAFVEARNLLHEGGAYKHRHAFFSSSNHRVIIPVLSRADSSYACAMLVPSWSFQVPKSLHDSVTWRRSLKAFGTASLFSSEGVRPHSTKKIYCQARFRLGLVFILVKFSPCALKISNALANAPGEEWSMVNEIKVLWVMAGTGRSCAVGALDCSNSS